MCRFTICAYIIPLKITFFMNLTITLKRISLLKEFPHWLMGFKKYVFFAFFLDFYITLNLHMHALRTKSLNFAIFSCFLTISEGDRGGYRGINTPPYLLLKSKKNGKKRKFLYGNFPAIFRQFSVFWKTQSTSESPLTHWTNWPIDLLTD